MKRIAALMLIWIASTAGLMAQIGGVTIEIVLDQDQYAPGEDIRVGVRIANLSGQTLELGQDNDWLQFSLENNQHLPVRQLGTIPVNGVFSLKSSERGTKWVRISPFFDLHTAGRFAISATMRVPNWPHPIKAAAVTMDISPGVVLNRVQFGVAAPNGATNAQPEVRYYLLQDSDRKQRRTLYFSVTDATQTKVYRALPLCQLLTFSTPELQVDGNSNAHVLSQNGAKSFLYYEINSEGVVLGRQTYQFTNTRPQLGLNKSGDIVVVGGERIFAKSDLPTPEIFEPATLDASAVKH